MDAVETLESVSLEGSRRLYPSLTNPSWLVLRTRRDIFQKWIDQAKPENFEVLDVGGRIQPYRPLFGGRVRRYLAIDLVQTPLVDIVGRAEQIPLRTGHFDLVICTQVLEYVSDPGAVMSEIYRVLKPGGVLLLSLPTLAARDADEEGWRILPFALRRLLSSFREAEIIPEGGSIVGIFRTINVALDVCVRYPSLRTVFRWTLCPAINVCGYVLDRLVHSHNDQFTANYSAWARK